MTDQTDINDLTREELIDEVQRLRGQLKTERQGYGRRTFVRGGLTFGGLIALLYASDPVAADPEGEYPAPSSDPFRKIRADRIRYISRSSQPSSPGSGRVISYVDDGDLP